MALQLNLVKLIEGSTADIDTVDLMTQSVDGFKLARDGWSEEGDPGDAPTINESMTLRVSSTSNDALATALQKIADRALVAQRYKTNVDQPSLWLRAQLTGETNARQSLIKALIHRPSRGLIRVETLLASKANEYQLGIERVPFWEDTVKQSFASTGVSAMGGMREYAASGAPVAGDADARIFGVSVFAPYLTFAMTQYWIGFRSDRYGNHANFVPCWNLHYATYLGTDATTSADGGDWPSADGSGYLTCSFVTSTALVERFQIVGVDVPSVVSHPTDQRGIFQILLRARNKLTADITRARLGYGLSGGGIYHVDPAYLAKNSRVVIDSTAWKFYDMGKVKIPIMNQTDSSVEDAFSIDAERVSASTGGLDMDCIVKIPMEGFVFQDNLQIVPSEGAGVITNHANGYVDSYTARTSYNRIAAGKVSGGIPVGPGSLVYAHSSTAGNERGDQGTIAISYFRRWATLRGAE